MTKFCALIVLSCGSLALMLGPTLPASADDPGRRDAPQSPDTPEAQPAPVPQTSQEWNDRFRSLTRGMTTREVLDAVGRSPDVISEKVNGRFKWTYRFTDPRTNREGTLYLFFRDNKYSHW